MKINRESNREEISQGGKGELFENFQRETNKNNGCIFYPISQRSGLKSIGSIPVTKFLRNLQVILFFYLHIIVYEFKNVFSPLFFNPIRLDLCQACLITVTTQNARTSYSYKRANSNIFQSERPLCETHETCNSARRSPCTPASLIEQTIESSE